MTTGIAEVFFGLLVLAVFVFLLVVTVTFESVIGTGKRRPTRATSVRAERPKPPAPTAPAVEKVAASAP